MKARFLLSSTGLLLLLVFSVISQIGASTIANISPEIIDVREMTFFDEMEARNAEYAEKSDWTLKISPLDTQYYKSTNETVYAEIYVSDTDDRLQFCSDFTGKTKNTFRVYTASEQAVKQMSEIPNTYFYASRFSPSICMTVPKQALQQIAANPLVYCIRIIPPLTPFLSISDVRVMDDIEYTMANHDSTLDASTHIVVIGSGYDPNDSYFDGDANDNIMPDTSFDFTDWDTDVSNGDNVHESTVSDTLVWGFGDFGTDTSMYENANFWTPLKICDDSYSTANQYASQAIEWCISHAVDIVCMSWGNEPPFMGINLCRQWWCSRLRVGALGGTTWVAAAGNDGHTNGVAYPAASHWVVAVGAYDNDPAQRESYSDYGATFYAGNYWGYLYYCTPCFWYGPQQVTEFKPNAYECGYLGYWGWGHGTSYSAPLACADIAIGMYSPNDGQYSEGYEYLLDVIALSHEYPVSPDASSQQGDVIDTHTLWHRQEVVP